MPMLAIAFAGWTAALVFLAATPGGAHIFDRVHDIHFSGMAIAAFLLLLNYLSGIIHQYRYVHVFVSALLVQQAITYVRYENDPSSTLAILNGFLAVLGLPVFLWLAVTVNRRDRERVATFHEMSQAIANNDRGRAHRLLAKLAHLLGMGN